jgi:hypothetical protein
MNRKDSGFMGSSPQKVSKEQTPSLRRSNTSPYRRRTAKVASNSTEISALHTGQLLRSDHDRQTIAQLRHQRTPPPDQDPKVVVMIQNYLLVALLAPSSIPPDQLAITE